MNQSGMNILKQCEGLDLVAEEDPIGIPTIGFGTIAYPNGKPVKVGDTCTEAQALDYLNYELKDKAASLESWINKNNLKLTGNQQSSLLCFAYNLGLGPILTNGSSLHDALLSGNEERIRDAFGLYVNGYKTCLGIKCKVKLNGLVTRRKLEADLFFTKDA